MYRLRKICDGKDVQQATPFDLFETAMTAATKRALYLLCQQYINKRIEASRAAIADVQRSANEETKSSAGDKYETGRAMAQLEIEKNAQQLSESLKIKNSLDQMRIDDVSETVQSGSLVTTDRGTFFLTISMGKVHVTGEPYVLIAPASPLGKALMGARVGEARTFNNIAYTIRELT